MPSPPDSPAGLRRDQVIGMAYALAAITAWGAYFPFAKVILAKISPITFLIFRFGIGTAVLVALCLRFRKSFAATRSDFATLVVAGLIGIVGHQFAQVWGLTLTTATNTGWIITITPPVTGVLGWLFLKERIALNQIAGLIVAMIGVFFFVSKGRPSQMSFAGSLGDLLILSNVFTWAIYTVIAKARLRAYDPLPMSAILMGLGFAVFLVAGGWRIPADAPALGATEWITVVLIGAIPSGLAYYWWNAGLKRLTAVNTSTFLFIEAIVASFVGHLVLGERFTIQMVVAALVIFIGVFVTQARRSSPSRSERRA